MSDVEARILTGARALFLVQGGYAPTSLQAIAHEACTSESGVLRVFASKSGVLRAVYASCWADVNRHIAEALRTAAERKLPEELVGNQA